MSRDRFTFRPETQSIINSHHTQHRAEHCCTTTVRGSVAPVPWEHEYFCAGTDSSQLLRKIEWLCSSCVCVGSAVYNRFLVGEKVVAAITHRLRTRACDHGHGCSSKRPGGLQRRRWGCSLPSLAASPARGARDGGLGWRSGLSAGLFSSLYTAYIYSSSGVVY